MCDGFGARFRKLWPLLPLVWAIAGVSSGWASCRVDGGADRVGLQAALDGDTLVLEGGARLRLIGINAPEVAGSNWAEEPLANEATRAARRFLEEAGLILVQPGVEVEDRYGRLLAHVFDEVSGESLASYLLNRGLAWRVAVPPNLRYQDCLADAEQRARAAARGVWSPQRAQIRGAEPLKGGFNLLSARIVSVKFGRNWWLNTDRGFAAQIRPEDQLYFDRDKLERWQSVDVELRGWMYNRAGSRSVARGYDPWVLILRHPSSIALAR